MKTNFRFFKIWMLIVLGISLLAFTRPQKGDIVELRSWLSARSSAFFRKIDHNRIKTLQPGTRGLITKTKYFSRTGNYGICVDIQADGKNQCVWVYYNKRRPNMRLIHASQNASLDRWHKNGRVDQNTRLTDDPEEANAAQTTTDVPAIADENIAPEEDTIVVIGKKLPKENPEDSIEKDAQAAAETAQAVVDRIDRFNEQAQEALNPGPVCKDCGPQLTAYPRCNSRNSYQESAVEQFLNSGKMAEIYQTRQTEIIRTSCFQRGLDTAPADSVYRHCNNVDNYPQRSVVRACTSKNYVELTAKSFNAVANCLADYVSGSSSRKEEASLMIFSLIAHESGLQSNAVSYSGAGGMGQMTKGAIKAVNIQLPNIIAHLKSSSNPMCSQTLADVLKEPMSSSSAKLCDRLALGKNNPLKNLMYTFALQKMTRDSIQDSMQNRIFSSVIDKNISSHEKERLYESLAAWAHNTGTGGMQVPLRYLMSKYLRQGKKISDGKDVDNFLKELAPVMRSFPHRLNRGAGRRTETSGFFRKITNRMSLITSEPKSCLAQ